MGDKRGDEPAVRMLEPFKHDRRIFFSAALFLSMNRPLTLPSPHRMGRGWRLAG